MDAVPALGTGFWTTNSISVGITDATSPTTAIENLTEGVHVFTWTISNGTCIDYDSDIVTITVTDQAADQASAGLEQNLCGVTSTTLEGNASFSDPDVVGTWTQPAGQAGMGVVINNPNDPNTTVSNLVVGPLQSDATFTFTWTLSNGVCGDFDTDDVIITISSSPIEIATAGFDEILCEDRVFLEGNAPALGFGTWTTTTPGVIITEANNPSTIAENLIVGDNVFIWGFTNGTCGDYSSDTIVITQGVPYGPLDLETVDDVVISTFNTMIDTFPMFLNDILDAADYEVTIIDEPQNGRLVEERDGTYSYEPDYNYLGNDTLTYSVCATNECGTYCDTAGVNIIMDISEDCWVPNIITPNVDNNNDTFIIPCLANYPNNKLTVFNRWGDKVYQAAPYMNDWQGTYNNTELPQGTYYYILVLDQATGQTQGGYLTIHR